MSIGYTLPSRTECAGILCSMTLFDKAGELLLCLCHNNSNINMLLLILLVTLQNSHNINLPVCLKQSRLSLSMGKYPTVAPYSGHMLAIVALSAIDNCDTPLPKNSTNLPTTPMLRRCCNIHIIKQLLPTLRTRHSQTSDSALVSQHQWQQVKGSAFHASPYGPLRLNVTSSIKPEVHNVSQCHQED